MKIARNVLIVILLVGIAAIVATWLLRERVLHPVGPNTMGLAPEEVVRLGKKARGPSREVTYMEHDMAQVMAFAPTEFADGSWKGLPAGTVMQVLGVLLDGPDLWVRGTAQGSPRAEVVRVHSSFLERYLPLLLDKTVELSNVKLTIDKSSSNPRMSVSGWLRNVTSQPLSQCVVTCVFQDRNDREVDVRRTDAAALPPLQLVRFHADSTDKNFASIALQITHATPDGLRNYLSTVVIQKSNL